MKEGMKYTCKRCGKSYVSDRGEADTVEAFKVQKWKEGDAVPVEQAVPLCEPCYLAFVEWYGKEGKQ